MNWQEFCTHNSIPPKYHKANVNLCPMMSLGRQKICVDWVMDPTTSMAITGEAGRGKTYFAMATIRALYHFCPHAYIRFFKTKILDDKIMEEFSKYGTSKGIKEQVKDADFLFLDDFGAERNTERAELDLYEIIDHRVDWEKPTIITTNLSQEEILERFGARIHSRLKTFVWKQFSGDDIRENIGRNI